jgi:hypothetical protein
LQADQAEPAKPSGDGYNSVAEYEKDAENSACAQHYGVSLKKSTLASALWGKQVSDMAIPRLHFTDPAPKEIKSV